MTTVTAVPCAASQTAADRPIVPAPSTAADPGWLLRGHPQNRSCSRCSISSVRGVGDVVGHRPAGSLPVAVGERGEDLLVLGHVEREQLVGAPAASVT